MKLLIAGKNRSDDVGAPIVALAAELREIRFRVPEHSALSLKQAANASEYMEQFTRLMRLHHGVSTDSLSIDARPGWKGRLAARIKLALWKVLRYQHDQVMARQNVINELVVTAIDFERTAMRERVNDLEKRLAITETSLAELRAHGENDGGAL